MARSRERFFTLSGRRAANGSIRLCATVDRLVAHVALAGHAAASFTLFGIASSAMPMGIPR